MIPFDAPILYATTADPNRSRHFYGTVLKMPLVGEAEDALVFRAGEANLRIHKVTAVAPTPHAVLGWRVPDLDKTMSQLKEQGVLFLRLDGLADVRRTPGGALLALFKDPDGNVIALVQSHFRETSTGAN